MKYGSTTWHPLNKILTNRLESCQRFTCWIVLQSWKACHEDVLFKSNLPLLSERRDNATLCHLFKIVHDLCSSPNLFKPQPRPNLRNLNSCALNFPFCRLTLSQGLFYPYTPTLWNYLLEDIVQCKSMCSFKDGCSFPSCVIIVCFILFCLVPLVCHILCCFFSHISVCYCLVHGHPFNPRLTKGVVATLLNVI